MAAFHGKPRGGAAGEMSRRTERLRPAIALRPAQVAEARRLPLGTEPDQIATALDVATDEVEKALVQRYSLRHKATRGTLNVTLVAHKVFLRERLGDEPLWKTVDRVVDELLQLRAEKTAFATAAGRRETKTQVSQLPLL